MLPYYSVFDNLTFRIEGVDDVVLMGQVVKPTLKQDAENVVRGIEAVGKVVNNIEVLPLSPNDDILRRAAFPAIYSREGLDRYAMSAVPSIHIIVKNGNITLEGVAANQAEAGALRADALNICWTCAYRRCNCSSVACNVSIFAASCSRCVIRRVRNGTRVVCSAKYAQLRRATAKATANHRETTRRSA